MKSHLGDEQLIGYVHHTLTDAQREAMDRHLATCPDCRARLAEHEALQRRMRNSLMGDLRAVQPTPSMTFSAIAPRLKQQGKLGRLWRGSRQLFPAATVVTALAGLVLALIGLIRGVGQAAVLKPASTSPLLTAACALFAIPAVGHYYQSRRVPLRLVLSSVLALVLWLGTAVVGLQAIIVVRDLCMWFCILASGDFAAADLVGQIMVFISAVAWLALIVGGGEYHYRRVGQRSSWKLFGWTITVELLIVSLPHVL